LAANSGYPRASGRPRLRSGACPGQGNKMSPLYPRRTPGSRRASTSKLPAGARLPF
jgi:hypothetical protein